jgi:hypothetical protein
LANKLQEKSIKTQEHMTASSSAYLVDERVYNLRSQWFGQLHPKQNKKLEFRQWGGALSL